MTQYDGTIKIAANLDSGNLRKDMEGLGGLAGTFGKTIAAGLAVATTAFIGISTQAMKFRGELEQNIGGSEAVFKQFANTVQNKGKTAFKDMGLSMSDFLATANKMGSLFQGAGFGIEKSADLSAKAMQRAAAVASIMGIDVGFAMESIAGAAKGNFTMMDNLGVAMNATSIEAYALSKGIDKSYNSMSQQEKIGYAMEMFLEKTAYAAGNYARENETLAGSLNTASAAFQNFLSGAGSIDDVVETFTNAGQVIAETLLNLLPGLIDGVITLVDSLIPMIPEVLEKILPILADGAVSLVKSFAQMLIDNIPMILDAVGQIITAIADGLADISPIFQPIADGIKLIVSNLDVLIPIVTGAIAGFIAFKAAIAISGVVKTAETALRSLLTNGISSLINPLTLVVIGAGALTGAISSLGNETRAMLKPFSDAIDESKEMVEESKRLKGAFDDNVKSIQNESAYARTLVKDIEELKSKEELTTDQKIFK